MPQNAKRQLSFKFMVIGTVLREIMLSYKETEPFLTHKPHAMRSSSIISNSLKTSGQAFSASANLMI